MWLTKISRNALDERASKVGVQAEARSKGHWMLWALFSNFFARRGRLKAAYFPRPILETYLSFPTQEVDLTSLGRRIRSMDRTRDQ
jgi:hypothetical protein